MVRYVFTEPWCPANRLAWYNIMILSAHTSGMANSAVSLSGVVTNLNSRTSNKIKLSAKVSTLHIAPILLGNLFWAKYLYISLKYRLVKYFLDSKQ